MTGVTTGRSTNSSRLRTLLVGTTAATYVLLLLGIYTAAAGAGLTCGARWPLCDGAVFGLFPANWPSFIEWFHRLVAMITGFLILGSAYGGWRYGADRRITAAMAVAVVLLPVQIWLGARTVLTYTFLSLTGHFITALVIFGAVVLSTLWYLGDDAASLGRVRSALLAVVGLYPVLVALSPGALFDHTAAVQAIYYAVGVAILAALLAAAAWTGPLPSTDRLGRVRALASVGAVLVGVQLLLGRYVYTDFIQLLDTAVMAAVFLIAAVAAWLVNRSEPADGPAQGASQ